MKHKHNSNRNHSQPVFSFVHAQKTGRADFDRGPIGNLAVALLQPLLNLAASSATSLQLSFLAQLSHRLVPW